MSHTPSRRAPTNQRRCSGGTGARQTHNDSASRVRAVEGCPTPRMHPTTPRRQAKYTICSDNHGIRPPTPEQYLTPLQQKEVCIRHLRARLRENVERLQHRDCEIDDLRSQLYKMQEDWIVEECQRLEAQLALKEARKEILHLQEVVESVRSGASGVSGAREPQEARGKSRSCGCSPASTLSRRSSEAPQLGPGGPHPSLLDPGLLCDKSRTRPPSSLSRSFTCDRMCGGGAGPPLSHSCHSLSSGCPGHGFLPHHHLFLHLPQEEPPLPPKRPEVRSQACSPTMNWLAEDTAPREQSILSPSDPTQTLFPFPLSSPEPLVSQPLPGMPAANVEEELKEEEEEEPEALLPPQRSHWSRYFLVDLLALAVPMMPTMAWLCRGAPGDIMPACHIGSLLRGCCAVALHSIRRQGAGRGRSPPSISGGTAF